jgi:streptogramin lyase
MTASSGWATSLSLGDYVVTDAARQAVFQVDPTTGNRTVISGCADISCSSTIGGGALLSAPTGLARGASFDPTAAIYVTDTLTDSLIRIDPTTGYRTVVSSSFRGSGLSFLSPTSVSVQANGDLLVVDESRNSLFRVDPTTGNRTVISGCIDASCSSQVGAGAIFDDPHDLAIEMSGDVILFDAALDAVFRVDATTGDRSVLSSNLTGVGPEFISPRNITIDASGFIFVTDSNLTTGLPGLVMRIDPLTGDRTIVGSGDVGSGRDLETPVGLTVDASGNIVLLDFAPGIVLSMDPTTGDRVILSSSQQGTGMSLSGPNSIISIQGVIPEPSTALLLGVGLAWLGRRRSGSSASGSSSIGKVDDIGNGEEQEIGER